MTAEAMARVLGGRRVGTGWMVSCPAHDDRRPSLSVCDADNGTVLVRCHAGCEQSAVIEALRDQGLWHNYGLHRPGAVRWSRRPAPRAGVDDTDRSRVALDLWRASGPASGTVGRSLPAIKGPHPGATGHPALPCRVDDIRRAAPGRPWSRS